MHSSKHLVNRLVLFMKPLSVIRKTVVAWGAKGFLILALSYSFSLSRSLLMTMMTFDTNQTNEKPGKLGFSVEYWDVRMFLSR
jgi:hypothetical protein